MIENLWAFSDFTPALKVILLFISHNFNSLDKKHKKAHITEDHNSFGCDNMQFGIMVPTRQGKLLPPSSRQKIKPDKNRSGMGNDWALNLPIGSTDGKSQSDCCGLVCATICHWFTNSPHPSPPFIYLNHILGPFAELQKATINFVISVSLSLHLQ